MRFAIFSALFLLQSLAVYSQSRSTDPRVELGNSRFEVMLSQMRIYQQTAANSDRKREEQYFVSIVDAMNSLDANSKFLLADIDRLRTLETRREVDENFLRRKSVPRISHEETELFQIAEALEDPRLANMPGLAQLRTKVGSVREVQSRFSLSDPSLRPFRQALRKAMSSPSVRIKPGDEKKPVGFKTPPEFYRDAERLVDSYRLALDSLKDPNMANLQQSVNTLAGEFLKLTDDQKWTLGESLRAYYEELERQNFEEVRNGGHVTGLRFANQDFERLPKAIEFYVEARPLKGLRDAATNVDKALSTMPFQSPLFEKVREVQSKQTGSGSVLNSKLTGAKPLDTRQNRRMNEPQK